jgi:hypothetical protein
MSSPERLNVLLSRARNGLIIIGNSETFLKSRSGKETWSKFFDMIKRLGYFYEGFPVQCELHNNAKNLLGSPEDFERLSPNGRCTKPWFVPFLTVPDFADCLNPWSHSGATMNCGIHTCPFKCHGPQDHKDLTCPGEKLQLPCGHSFSRGCNQPKAPLITCFRCKVKRNAGANKAADENGAWTNGRPSTSAGPRPPALPISPTSPWRNQQAATTGGSGVWGSGRSADHSRRGTDTYKDGLSSWPKLQLDPSHSSQGKSGRKGPWRPTHSK